MTYEVIFSALADPTRRTLFEGLRPGPKTVSQLAAGQTVSRPAISQHMRVLREAGLVNVQPSGTSRYYSIRHEGLAPLRDYLDSFWTDVLSAYRDEIQCHPPPAKGNKNARSGDKDN